MEQSGLEQHHLMECFFCHQKVLRRWPGQPPKVSLPDCETSFLACPMPSRVPSALGCLRSLPLSGVSFLARLLPSLCAEYPGRLFFFFQEKELETPETPKNTQKRRATHRSARKRKGMSSNPKKRQETHEMPGVGCAFDFRVETLKKLAT